MFPTDERDERDRATVPAGLVLASIRRRFGGALIDYFLVLIPSAIGAAVAGYRPGDELSDDAILVFNITLAATALIYETVLIGALGRTVGKFATGTRVVRQTDGAPIGWFAALQRALVPVVFGSIPQVGFALGFAVYGVALLGPLRQGLHDRAAGTLVVLNGVRVPAA